MSLDKILKERTTGKVHPVLAWCDEEGKVLESLSGPNLWNMGAERLRELKALGARPGDFLESHASGKNFIVDFIACLKGKLVLVPVQDERRVIVPNDRRDEFRQKQVVLEVSSSGTTGEKKKRYYTQDGLLRQLEAHSQFFADAPENERLALLPWTHAFGLVLDLLLGLYDRAVIYCPVTDGLKRKRKWIARMLNLHAIGHICVVPRQLELILFDDDLPVRAPARVHVGGAHLSATLSDRVQRWMGAGEIVEGYGLTEAGPGVLMNGRPVGCEVRIHEDILFVKSPSWSFDENLSTCDEWESTGDIAQADDDGRVRIACRRSRRLKSTNGVWLSLDELERSLERLFSLRAVMLGITAFKVQVCAFSDFELTKERNDALALQVEKTLGLPVELRVFVKDALSVSSMERAVGKDLTNFFELQQAS